MEIKKLRVSLTLVFIAIRFAFAAVEVKPAILCLDRGAAYPVARLMHESYGFHFADVSFKQLNWETLTNFNAVMLFDLSRLNPEAINRADSSISPDEFQRIGDLLERYVHAGGGLYIYGVSFTHMGMGWAADTLNRFLERFDARILFEEFRDPPREQRQPGGRKVFYALADEIETHPATEGVKQLWYATGPFSYGPWTRPLNLGDAWQSLVRSSTGFVSRPLGNPLAHAKPIEGAVSTVSGDRAALYAVRAVGDGRIVLNGGESTISWYGHAYSDYADEQWGRIGMEAGLDGIPSDGRQLLASSLRWLAQPSLEAGTFGGFRMPPPAAVVIPRAEPITWAEPREKFSERGYARGVFAGLHDPGQVAEYIAAARDMGLDYLVCAGDFERMTEADWDALVAACAAGSDETFLAMPAVITRDEHGNSFLQTGTKSWPRADVLSPEQPKRVRDQLKYWMVQAAFPIRVAFNFSAGHYPPWLFSGYSAFGVRTWRDGELIDESPQGLFQAGVNGDRVLPVSVHLLSAPEKLREVSEFSMIGHRGSAALRRLFMEGQFTGSALGYITSGPRLTWWHAAYGARQTHGDEYVPGRERWRVELGIASDTPLAEVEIWNGEALWRRYALSGTEANLTMDGLHDNRHSLTLVVRDVLGNEAVSGSMEIQDGRFNQFFCSDRCNIMLGHSTVRQADGQVKVLPATTMIYKAGRLSASAVSPDEGLPGIDGSGTGSLLGLHADLKVPEIETRSLVHRIIRPLEHQDVIYYDLPILKRSTAPGHEIYGHAPFVPLVEPVLAAGNRQWHFYREDRGLYPTMTEFHVANETDEEKPLVRGWNGFSIFWAQSPGWFPLFERYAILRAGGERLDFPVEGQATWRGDLETGDLFYMPGLGEGFVVLEGSPHMVVDCIPGTRGRFWLGESDTTPLAPGERRAVRLLLFKFRMAPEDAEAALLKMRDGFGLADGKPAYALEVTRGEALDRRYLLRVAAEEGGARLRLPAADLQQRLPIRVEGLADNTTAGVIDFGRNEWKPLDVIDGALYTTLDTQRGDHDLYIGNLLACDHPDLRLTLLPANADGRTVIKVHNPTETAITANIFVALDSFLAKPQVVEAAVLPKSSVIIRLDGGGGLGE